MVDTDADPVAYHTPVTVPVHCQDDDKAGLYQDVSLGVFEKVRIGEPLTWCHSMVICAKKTPSPGEPLTFNSLINVPLVKLTTPSRPFI